MILNCWSFSFSIIWNPVGSKSRRFRFSAFKGYLGCTYRSRNLVKGIWSRHQNTWAGSLHEKINREIGYNMNYRSFTVVAKLLNNQACKLNPKLFLTCSGTCKQYIINSEMRQKKGTFRSGCQYDVQSGNVPKLSISLQIVHQHVCAFLLLPGSHYPVTVWIILSSRALIR